MKTFWHLVKRFFGSLKQKTVSEEDLLWVENILSQEEMHLWQTMPENDKCHSIEVARRTGTLLGKLEPEVLAAALLHDVGKAKNQAGLWVRVFATLLGLALPARKKERWAKKSGITGKIGQYLQHPAQGADLLRAAGSVPLVIAWAEEHHLPERAWTINPEIGNILNAADND